MGAEFRLDLVFVYGQISELTTFHFFNKLHPADGTTDPPPIHLPHEVNSVNKTFKSY